ncbi:MAG: hypothetical protein Q4F55_00360 [Bacillota bacterium]|nr:hypothetical protein [Bacillota bacterium]
MKKILALILALVMICSFAACGNNEPAKEENELAKLYADGFATRSVVCDEESWSALFMKDESLEIIYKATAPFTKELYEQYEAIDWEDEAAYKNLYCNLENVTVEDITYLIPTEEDLQQFVGMKFGELEDLGWYNSGWTGGEGEAYTFYYDGPIFYGSIVPEETVMDIDDLSTNDMRELTVKEMIFMGISSSILDQ